MLPCVERKEYIDSLVIIVVRRYVNGYEYGFCENQCANLDPYLHSPDLVGHRHVLYQSRFRRLHSYSLTYTVHKEYVSDFNNCKILKDPFVKGRILFQLTLIGYANVMYNVSNSTPKLGQVTLS